MQFTDGTDYPCYFQCGNVMRSKRWIEDVKGWDWFTGKLRFTVHLCPQCRKERRKEIWHLKLQAAITD